MKRHLLVALSSGFSNIRIGENLGIRYIKSYLNKNGYKVDILENQFERLDINQLSQKINEYDIVGFSINYCGQVEALKEIVKYIDDKKNKTIYVGGHFASICYANLLKDISEIDFVMLADGEYATLELVINEYCYKDINNVAYLVDGELICKPILLVEQLDDLPFPYRDKNSYYLGDKHFSMISSRGCYNSCTYCSVGAFTKYQFHKNVRRRSAKNIFAELEFLNDAYEIQYISFQDDLFIGADITSQNHAKELAELIIASKREIYFSIQCSVNSVNKETFSLLYRAGLRNVMIGIENFSDHALKCFNKIQKVSEIESAILILREIGLTISYGFIMYYPEMEFTEILENIEILHNLELINFRTITNKLQIYHGTAYSEKNLDYCIEIENNGYTINYFFKNSKINRYIEECKKFSKEYGNIEKMIMRLEFLACADPQIDKESVKKLSSTLKDCIYIFAKAKYFEIFYGIAQNDESKIRNCLQELRKELRVKSL